jgi:DHA1 family multidrug resistance protein-like MFS transporter
MVPGGADVRRIQSPESHFPCSLAMNPSIVQPEAPLAANRTRRAVLIAVLMVVVFLYWISMYLYVPTLPLYIQSKTPDLALVGTALSMYGLWQIISRLPLGICVDWVGRRKPFIFSWLLLAALGDWMLGGAANIGAATLGRAVVGIAAGGWVLLVVMFSGLFEPGEILHATAVVSMVGTASRIVATSANGWLNSLGGYPLAFRLAALAALIAAVIVLFLPDAPRPPKKPSLSRLRALATRRDVMLPSLLHGLLHVGDFAATFTFIPILARQKGASDVAISLLLSLDLALALAGNIASPALARRIGRRWVARLAILLMVIGIGAAALAPGLTVVFAAQLSVGFGFGLGYPLFMGMSIDRVDESERTTAMGLHQSVFSIGMFAGPWLGGILASALNIPRMFGIVAALILVCGMVGARFLEENRAAGLGSRVEETDPRTDPI